MTINGGIFVLQQVYNKQVSKAWPITTSIVKVLVTNLTTIDEGNSVVVNINTFDYIGQTLYWTISGVSGTINSSDFSEISGSFVVQSNNFGTFTVTTVADETSSEGTESFVIQIRTDSTSGLIKATSSTITINDTSVKILGDYGWYAGGFSTAHTSTVDRIHFASDTSTASVRGPLSVPNYSTAVLSNKDYAWVTGGDTNPGGITSIVSRITFNNDLSALSTRGPLSSIRASHAAVNVHSPAGTPSSGYLGGGPGPTSRVDRITYATDTATASARGPLSLARFGLAAAASTTIAWFGGGSGTPSFLSRVDRITFSSDTATATSRGPLTVSTRRLAASTNLLNGWFAGGETPALTSRVSRVTFSSDTVTASIRGPLTSEKSGLAAVNQSTVYGFYAGGSIGASRITTVDRITHSSDTITATSRGPISSSRYLFDGNNGSITA